MNMPLNAMESLRLVITRVTANPSVSVAACFASIYAAYYFLYVVKKPVIACGDKAFRKFIDKHCSISREKFWPTWWCFQSHVQTLLRALIQTNINVNYTGEYLKTPDGGEIRLDWVENEKSKYPSDSRPTILFLPGLTGSSTENYILHMVDSTTEMGYRSVVFNNRGTGGTSLKSPRTYCAANIEDIKLVITRIKEKYPDAPLVGVGVSLGGIIMINYLAREGANAALIAAMIVSPAYDLHQSRVSLDKHINYWIFNRHLASNLCKIFENNVQLFKELEHIDAAEVLKSESIKEFDERFTSKVFGFDSVDQYYTEASIHTKMHALAKPVLCLSAADDPFAPEYSIPIKEAEKNANIAIIKTSHGGHIGFLEGNLPRNGSYLYRWFKQYISAIFEHGFKDE
jgi:abhydrolase domain-containing protein 1/3